MRKELLEGTNPGILSSGWMALSKWLIVGLQIPKSQADTPLTKAWMGYALDL